MGTRQTAEVRNVCTHGFRFAEKELLVSFVEFRWLKETSIRAVTHIECLKALGLQFHASGSCALGLASLPLVIR